MCSAGLVDHGRAGSRIALALNGEAGCGGQPSDGVAEKVAGGACGDETSKYYDRAHPNLAIGALQRNISTLLGTKKVGVAGG
jgi:hypothetical protein